VQRHSSHGEIGLLRRLVAKHREDVQAMARDRKLNVGQRTAGQLSRAIAKAGGFGALMQQEQAT
jgi:nucleolar protein 16